MKIGVAIPTYIKHIKLLNRCLKSIENQTKKPKLVVISASSCSEEIKLLGYSFPIEIIQTENSQNAAANRNIAGNFLNQKDIDIISFIDSDDEMYPKRLEFIEKAFIETECDFLVHNFTEIKNHYEKHNLNFEDYHCIQDCLISNPNHCGITLNDVKTYSKQLTHGHISVSSNLWKKEKYKTENDYLNWEDSEYCRRLVEKKYKGVYLPSQLTKYNNYNFPQELFEKKAKLKIFTFWTNEDNPLTENRKKCLENLKKTTDVSVILITKDNLSEWLLPEYPLHSSYNYLSSVHKADYLRCYFMHHYGGGYSDIKSHTESWKNSFDKLNSDPDILAIGYQEIEGGVAIIKNKNFYKEMCENYTKLIGNGGYIFKPRTIITKEWYEQLHNKLDEKLEDLKKNPANDNRDYYGKNINGEISKYPLEWTEILGNIFHPIVYKYNNKILKTLPKLIFENYQ